MDMLTALRNELRKHVFRTGTFAKPSELWFALHTGAPGADGSANEVSGNGYGRAQLDPSDSNWTAEATDGETKNAVTITFPAPSGGDWGQITHISVWTQEVGGDGWLADALVTPKTINDGDPAPKFAAGDLAAAFE